jgi:hypothetical protein
MAARGASVEARGRAFRMVKLASVLFKVFRPDGRSAATLIPPVWGLAGVNL